MSTPLTGGQYSELVIALEAIRHGCDLALQWELRAVSPWVFVYLTQWFHKIGPLPEGRDGVVWCCTHMVAELCEERC